MRHSGHSSRFMQKRNEVHHVFLFQIYWNDQAKPESIIQFKLNCTCDSRKTWGKKMHPNSNYATILHEWQRAKNNVFHFILKFQLKLQYSNECCMKTSVVDHWPSFHWNFECSTLHKIFDNSYWNKLKRLEKHSINSVGIEFTSQIDETWKVVNK